MGTMFKVMAISQPQLAELPGFDKTIRVAIAR
jgi:hypothetical protein